MTLKQWNDFNCECLANTEWRVCLLDHSYNNKDKMLDALMKDCHALSLFGEYEVKRVQAVTAGESNYSTIKILLWPPVK